MGGKKLLQMSFVGFVMSETKVVYCGMSSSSSTAKQTEEMQSQDGDREHILGDILKSGVLQGAVRRELSKVRENNPDDVKAMSPGSSRTGFLCYELGL